MSEADSFLRRIPAIYLQYRCLVWLANFSVEFFCKPIEAGAGESLSYGRLETLCKGHIIVSRVYPQVRTFLIRAHHDLPIRIGAEPLHVTYAYVT